MATNNSFEKQIWDAACVLRGNMDASEYKNVVLGLIFLKYISDRFDEKYQSLVAEGDGFEEDVDEYTSEGIFFVPENARWSVIASKAHTPEIGTVIDEAMRAIEKENKRLKDILPKNFARPELDKRRLGDVVDLFTNIQMIDDGSEKDILGNTYQYCLRKFAENEGKLAGEFFTPECVVKTLVEVLQPYNGRVYDPCCGSGGMFVQSAKFVENHRGNFVLDSTNKKDLFLKEALLLKQSHSLCSSMTTEQERHDAAYFEAVRAMIMKITIGGQGGKPLSLTEINKQINELLKASIQSEGVINLFDSKTVGENFSLFDPHILEEIAKMKEKNIAVEILRKLMAEQVAIYKRTNVVKSEKFSEKIAKLMNAYYNGLITNEEVIKELLEAAQEIANLHKEGEKLGLTTEELAFYDALTKPEAVKDFYTNEDLIAITRELTEMLRKNRTIDWQKKETARAGMRKMVKRLLKKYKYPPEGMDDAVQTVMTQCELWTDNMGMVK